MHGGTRHMRRRQTPSLTIRWMLRRDLDEVTRIERLNYDDPWDEIEFVERLRKRNTIAMVAEYDERVVGYVMYELHGRYVEIINVAVLPSMQRKRIGTELIERIVDKLSPGKRTTAEAVIWGGCLSGHLFFASCGFLATGVIWDEETNDDAYVFEYKIGDQS